MKEYNLMCCNTKVGTFYVDEDVYDREFRISLIPKYIGSPCMLGFKFLHKDFELSDSMVRHFIKCRVVPRNRMNIDDILKRIGLSEYDDYLIAKHNKFACVNDKIWVDLYGERFEDVRPDAEIHLSKLDPIIAEDAIY